jgi:hypothetical protein
MKKIAQGRIGNPALGNLEGHIDSSGGVWYLDRLLSVLVTAFLAGGVIYFMFNFLLGAISLIGAGGDSQKVEGARGKITSAIVGLVVLLGAFALVSLIENLFGIDLLVINFGSLVI